jgi:hypothetical protein
MKKFIFTVSSIFIDTKTISEDLVKVRELIELSSQVFSQKIINSYIQHSKIITNKYKDPLDDIVACFIDYYLTEYQLHFKISQIVLMR